jgi:hypothetical protein
MNKFTMYTPFKGESFNSIKGKGYTQKGKNSVSYTVDEFGKKISCWIRDKGGHTNVLKIFKKLITLNHDRYSLAKYFNISPSTCKSFIFKNLTKESIENEKINLKRNSYLRRSLNLKGKNITHKGKTYEEIYGTKTPKCGFKKGDLNPNFTRDKYVGCTLTNFSGKRFRSSYEVKFSNLLEFNNITYNYEHRFKLCNGKVKIVDFIINDKFVEVTGYAYDKWKQDFDIKIQLLHQSYPDKEIVIISTTDKVEELKQKHSNFAKILNLDNDNDLKEYFLS